MGPLFRVLSILAFCAWAIVTFILVSASAGAWSKGSDTSAAGNAAAVAVLAYGWSGSFGMLTASAVLHIAAEVSELVALGRRRSSGRGHVGTAKHEVEGEPVIERLDEPEKPSGKDWATAAVLVVIVLAFLAIAFL